MTAMLIRAATDADLDACARLMSTSEPWVTLGRDHDASMAILRDPTREVYVAERDGALAGFAILCVTGAFIGYLQSVAVDPRFRGAGIGSELIAFVEERIFRVSPNVFICVSSFNDRARVLYERLGYAYVGALTDYIVRGHDELLFRKTRGPLTEHTP
jgi:[ribosomal protein S18]-alanine N-acetyltransferase